jgi:hypothetical protein
MQFDGRLESPSADKFLVLMDHVQNKNYLVNYLFLVINN